MTQNLRYYKTLPEEQRSIQNPWKLPDQFLLNRNEWLQRQMQKFYSDEEIEQVLRNRRSDFSDEALINDFAHCEQPNHPIPEDVHFLKAIKLVTENFRPKRVLHPIHYADLRYYPWNLQVSAESPWTEKEYEFIPFERNVDAESKQPKLSNDRPNVLRKWTKPVRVEDYLKWKHSIGMIEDSSRSFHNLYEEIFVYNRTLIHKIKHGEEPFWKKVGDQEYPQPYKWNTLHARSHVVGDDEPDKIRAVFGATKLLLMAELMFIWALQASYLNTDAGKLLWGREMSRGGWPKLYNEMHRNGPPQTLLGVDWSQFDKRLLHQLIRIVHNIWKGYFDFSSYEPTSTYSGSVNPEKIERLWKWMCSAITGTPILLPNGQLWYWNWNGFGSGYQQTQLMDTFANAIMIYTCLLSLGINVESKDFWARFQGDDSIIAFFEQMFVIYGNNFLVMLEASAKHYFNAKLNVKKSQIQRRAHGMTVLSYSNRYGYPFRKEEDLLRHLYFPERPQDYGRLAASAAGLAQADLGNHKRFYDLCELIWTKIVVERETQPKWKVLRWLARTGQEEILNNLMSGGFPNYFEILEQGVNPVSRSENENQRQWPTTVEAKNGFYFLNSLSV